MTPELREYRRRAAAFQMLRRAHNHMVDQQRTLIDQDKPCRDVDRAVKYLAHFMEETAYDLNQAHDRMSSGELWDLVAGEESEAL